MKTAQYRKLNDHSCNSSTYHKKDGTNSRAKLKAETAKETAKEVSKEVSKETKRE